ncbi:MAG: hypothetical protein LUE22_06505 [Oscillospiraceae bacterium]|nr:hypothetical protein [Oscillospiraceae bacterium]
MYVYYNPSPSGRNVGDCTVRAISKALGQDWEQTYTGLAVEGYLLNDMPSSNVVWGSYLKSHGFKRQILPDDCHDCYSVADFAADHPRGTYILALSGHVVCVEDGNWFDTWNSGNEIPLYYWERT